MTIVNDMLALPQNANVQAACCFALANFIVPVCEGGRRVGGGWWGGV